MYHWTQEDLYYLNTIYSIIKYYNNSKGLRPPLLAYPGSYSVVIEYPPAGRVFRLLENGSPIATYTEQELYLYCLQYEETAEYKPFL